MTEDQALIASRACRHDPSLEPARARELAAEALRLAEDDEGLDAPGLARRLLAAHPSYGASAATVVARAAVEHLAP